MKISVAAAVLSLLRAARSAEGGVVAAPADAAETVASAGGLRGTDASVDAPGPGAAARATPRGRRGRRELSTGATPGNLALIDVPELPDARPPVKICLIGSGYAAPDVLGDAEDLLDRVTGGSFVAGSDWTNDETGQGTHIAGIIGAIIPDPYKYLLHVIKVSTPPTAAQAVLAINQCITKGARIISFSRRVSDRSLEEAFQNAYDEGALIIAPAGNTASDVSSIPTVMCVDSVKADGTCGGSSVFSPYVELAAPGEDIESTCSASDSQCSDEDACYCAKSGTEYAAAHVAGVAALLTWRFPQCSNNQIRNTMLRSASEPEALCNRIPRSPYGWDEFYGMGIVNARDALELLEREGCAGAGGPDPAAGERSDLAVGGQWQGCGKRGGAKCDRDNESFLPCCEHEGVACAILNEHEEGWCGCAPRGERCSPDGEPLPCCEGECVLIGKGVGVCQLANDAF